MGEWTEQIDVGKVPENGTNFDVIVVGGGPGGSAAASYHSMNGQKVLLLEKEIWPRDKICGDAVGGKSLRHVKELGVKTMIEATPHFRVDSILMSSSNGTEVKIELPKEAFEKMEAGYALPRIQFDYMMFKRATEILHENGGYVMQGFSVTDVKIETEGSVQKIIGIDGKTKDGELMTFSAPLTIGAGGYNCPVAKTITETVYEEPMRDIEHYCGAYREYWNNVKGCEGDSGAIELHFIDEVNPGYFWIFPVNDGTVNVGIGMVISEQRKQVGIKKSLKKMQKDVIANHPLFKGRFENANLVEGSERGWQLPFGSPRKDAPSYQPRRSAMAGAMCIGDAASLVDPFSGEGIGNALVSAKLTSEIFDKNIHSDGFSEESANKYMKDLWDKLGPELTNSYKLQQVIKRKWLLNWFMKKASKKESIREMMTEMIAGKEASGGVYSKWFVIKALLLP
ncbi:MAG: NAD(P)/FAD-dependent oxidoreductase [Euryarchaeota archaeon]|nr:NAD(P)/FAD-dependent oxidoreductase [Euryarchaeota archaeon]